MDMLGEKAAYMATLAGNHAREVGKNVLFAMNPNGETCANNRHVFRENNPERASAMNMQVT